MTVRALPTRSPRTPGAGRRASIRGGRRRRAARIPASCSRGFTLIEVLLATVLLAAGLTLAFATLSAATRTTQRAEDLAARSERLRAVEGFLRRRLEGARPVPFAYDPGTGAAKRFEGSSDSLRFVADLPDYLGRGGPYLHELAIQSDGDRERLTVDLRMVLAGEIVEESDPRPPEVLVEGLRSVRFRYRSLAPEGGLGEWLDRWENSDQMPLLVEITLTDADGRDWPPLVVSLPLAASMAGAAPMAVP